LIKKFPSVWEKCQKTAGGIFWLTKTLVTKCSRSFYALKSIRAHSLNGSALWDITRATLVSQLQYACPAWWGYLKADERNRLKSIVSKAIRYGFLPHSFCTVDELREDADEKLFYSSRYNPNHVLHRLLPQPKRNDYNLRQRTHNLTLPTDGNPVMKQNFVYRMVFKDIYWFLSNVQCYFTKTLLFIDIYCI